MTDTTTPAVQVQPAFTLLGDPGAAVCEGDFCLIPDHHEQAVINRRLDDDAV